MAPGDTFASEFQGGPLHSQSVQPRVVCVARRGRPHSAWSGRPCPLLVGVWGDGSREGRVVTAAAPLPRVIVGSGVKTWVCATANLQKGQEMAARECEIAGIVIPFLAQRSCAHICLVSRAQRLIARSVILVKCAVGGFCQNMLRGHPTVDANSGAQKSIIPTLRQHWRVWSTWQPRDDVGGPDTAALKLSSRGAHDPNATRARARSVQLQ